MARTKKSVGVKEGDIPVSVGTTVHPSSSGATIVVPRTPSSHNDTTVTPEVSPSAPFIVSPTSSFQAPRVTVHSVTRLTNSRSSRNNSVGSGSANSSSNPGGNAVGNVVSSTGGASVGIGVSDSPGVAEPVGTSSLGTNSISTGAAAGNGIATGLADMLAMGLRPAAVNPVPRSTGQVSYLKCCVVKDSETWAIVFRIEGYSWVERVFFNALRENAAWLRNWTFERNNEIFWYQNNESQRNPRNFKIRLFVLRVEARPTQAALVNVGNFLCRGLTNTPGNTNALEMVGTNYIWIRNPVWSDILGDNQALTYMVNGRPSFYQGKVTIFSGRQKCSPLDYY
jgi:hypothetical protein